MTARAADDFDFIAKRLREIQGLPPKPEPETKEEPAEQPALPTVNWYESAGY